MTQNGADNTTPPLHVFTRSEIKQCEHIFAEMIKKYFGEVWRIKSDGEYKGANWDCRSMIAVDPGLWRLIQHVKHKGAWRAAGHIETREVGTVVRFTIYYDPKDRDGNIIL